MVSISTTHPTLTSNTWLIRNLLYFAQQSAPNTTDLDVNEVINKALDLELSSSMPKNVQIIKEYGVRIPRIKADFEQLIQVFQNLIRNAIQAMPQGGELTISTSFNADQVSLKFHDTGCGISPENMSRLFTPFFTTRPAVKGVGLGLAASYGIIQRHKGRMEVQSKEGEGSTFSINLPLGDSWSD